MTKDYQIVFVQLGRAKAEHLWKNISSIKSEWPDCEVVLIADSSEYLKRASMLGIEIWEYLPSQEISELIRNSPHNPDFREGFWNYSLLRLFAVLEYSSARPEISLIHLESDITVFPNFPFKTLSMRSKPSWLRFNESHDVGSIFTVPGAEAANQLKFFFIEELKSNPFLTDMTLLNCVSTKHPESVELLPVARDSNDPLIRSGELDTPESERISSLFSVYNGIFDSAPIGMWLLGQDPRNHFGKIIRFRDLAESYIQPRLTNYTFDSRNQTLVTGSGVQIFNLHVHSKEPSYFDNRRAHRIEIRVKDSADRSKSISFSTKAFYALSMDYVKRNGVSGITKKIKSYFKICF